MWLAGERGPDVAHVGTREGSGLTADPRHTGPLCSCARPHLPSRWPPRLRPWTEPPSPRRAHRCPGRSCHHRSGAARCRAPGGLRRRPAGSRSHGAHPAGVGGSAPAPSRGGRHPPPSRDEPQLGALSRFPGYLRALGAAVSRQAHLSSVVPQPRGAGEELGTSVTAGVNALPASLQLPRLLTGELGLRAGSVGG